MAWFLSACPFSCYPLAYHLVSLSPLLLCMHYLFLILLQPLLWVCRKQTIFLPLLCASLLLYRTVTVSYVAVGRSLLGVILTFLYLSSSCFSLCLCFVRHIFSLRFFLSSFLCVLYQDLKLDKNSPSQTSSCCYCCCYYYYYYIIVVILLLLLLHVGCRSTLKVLFVFPRVR